MPPSDDEDRKQCNFAEDPRASNGAPNLRLPLPSWTMSLQPGVNPDPESKSLLLGVSSPIHPLHWLRFSLDLPQVSGHTASHSSMKDAEQHEPLQLLALYISQDVLQLCIDHGNAGNDTSLF